jgi:hypothetical protein
VYADAVRDAYATDIPGDPEDQLKAPVQGLLRAVGTALGKTVRAKTESSVDEVGRPDLGVSVGSHLFGHIELKSVDKGADPTRANPRGWSRHDKSQWSRFKALPNLIYTNGVAWYPFQVGQVVEGSPPVDLGDIVSNGSDAVTDDKADALVGLLAMFIDFRPIVPSSAKRLADLLAPMVRFLRDEVLADALNGGPMARLADSWRRDFFPDATHEQFADAYAQTFAYALLMGHLDRGVASEPLTAANAAVALQSHNGLLSQVLTVVNQANARDVVSLPVEVLEQTIGAVDGARLAATSRGNPWLMFYEDFIAAYDPAERDHRGVYYTPAPIVHAQAELVDGALKHHLGHDAGIASHDVVFLDPATGTGSYLLEVIRKALAAVEGDGDAVVAEQATALGKNINGFEVLVGPYAVAHLRVGQAITNAGGALPLARSRLSQESQAAMGPAARNARDVQVYLTDALAAPVSDGHAQAADLFQQQLAFEHEKASKVKTSVKVVVGLGNPPWDRAAGKGGIVRNAYTANGREQKPLLDTYKALMPERHRALHAMNLENDYVDFWRWMTWKILEQSTGPGIVCLITPNAFLSTGLTGDAFSGMRKHMRSLADHIYVLDLGGDAYVDPSDENMFGIRTPNAIVMLVREEEQTEARAGVPAKVHYRRLRGPRRIVREDGSEVGKEVTLAAWSELGDGWIEGPSDWFDAFTPPSVGDSSAAEWPALSTLMPWSARGMQYSRHWPIAATEELAKARWGALVGAKKANGSPDYERMQELLPQSARTKIEDRPRSFLHTDTQGRALRLPALNGFTGDRSAYVSEPPPDAVREVAWRSLDVQYSPADPRVIELPRPELWRCMSEKQVYLTGLAGGTTGGPTVFAQAFVPDLNAYNGRGGYVRPLWRDAAATQANVRPGVALVLAEDFGFPVTDVDVFCYLYGLLATPAFQEAFPEMVRDGEARVPVTLDKDLFTEVADLGAHLVWLHTRARRMRDIRTDARRPARLTGTASTSGLVQANDGPYPTDYEYEPTAQRIRVGSGYFTNVSREVWEFSICGFFPVQNYLKDRISPRTSGNATPLNQMMPNTWTFSRDFLSLLHAVEGTLAATELARPLLARARSLPSLRESDLPVSEEEMSAADPDAGEIPGQAGFGF